MIQNLNETYLNCCVLLIAEKVHNLDNFISMDSSNEFGPVLNLEEFKARFS